MNNFTQRLLLFIIGLPALLFIIIFFDRYQHAGWFVLVTIVTFFSTYESLGLFIPEYKERRRHLIPLFSALLPLSVYLEQIFFPEFLLAMPVLVAGALAILSMELLLWQPETAAAYTPRISGGIAALLYPGLLMAYAMSFIKFEYTVPAILLFLLLNFSNDTFAYIFGKLFGKFSKKVVPVSPKKTRIGFLGGFIGALLIGWAVRLIYPSLFNAGVLPLSLFFLLIALCADIGDLIESAFKRAASKKDSGTIMPGRGGWLDSIDSLLFSAPFFYYIGTILLN